MSWIIHTTSQENEFHKTTEEIMAILIRLNNKNNNCNSRTSVIKSPSLASAAATPSNDNITIAKNTDRSRSRRHRAKKKTRASLMVWFRDEWFAESKAMNHDDIVAFMWTGLIERIAVHNDCLDPDAHRECFEFAIRFLAGGKDVKTATAAAAASFPGGIESDERGLEGFQYVNRFGDSLTIEDADTMNVALRSSPRLKSLSIADGFLNDDVFERVVNSALDHHKVEQLNLLLLEPESIERLRRDGLGGTRLLAAATTKNDFYDDNHNDRNDVPCALKKLEISSVFYEPRRDGDDAGDKEQLATDLAAIVASNGRLEEIEVSRRLLSDEGRALLLDSVGRNSTLLKLITLQLRDPALADLTEEDLYEVEDVERSIDASLRLNRSYNMYVGNLLRRSFSSPPPQPTLSSSLRALSLSHAGDANNDDDGSGVAIPLAVLSIILRELESKPFLFHRFLQNFLFVSLKSAPLGPLAKKLLPSARRT